MNRLMLTALLPLLAMLALWGCTEESHDPYEPDNGGGTTPPEEEVTTCLGCHSSEEMLKASLAKVSGSKVAVNFKSDG